VSFDLPEMAALSRFDATPPGLARLFDRPEVRQRVAAQLKPQLDGATRVGLPAVIGLEHHAEAWQDLRERLGVSLFEIPTLPPSVPGMRLFNAFKAALTRAGVPILLDMTATRGLVDIASRTKSQELQSGIEASAGFSGQWKQPAKASSPEDAPNLYRNYATGVVVPDVVRDRTYRADTYILATGGLYGGGIASDYTGALHETIFDLPLHVPGEMSDWFEPVFLADQGHPIHRAGVRANRAMQPVDEAGNIVLKNVRIAGRLLANYDPLAEGSTEGVWLATAFRAATKDE
jgi:glycerol-3-phosphate dehydrogenase subunit B